MQSNGDPKDHLEVAIVGGGIAGISLALGLLARGITTTVYERSESLREIGAGIGFTPNSERAMKVLEPRIHAAFKRVTVQNGTDWFMWMDGFNGGGHDGDSREHELIHKMYLGERGFEGCARADFLEELVKMAPKGTILYRKTLSSIVDLGVSEKLELRFTDGTSGTADVGRPYPYHRLAAYTDGLAGR